MLPLLAGFFVTILFFFRVMQVQTDVQAALYYAGRRTACEAGAVNSEVILRVSAEAYFREKICQSDFVRQYVSNGSGGVSLLRSELSEEYVKLKSDYFIKLPINFFGVDGIYVSQCSVSRKWTGDRDDDSTEDYVYVTEHGRVYHRNRGCSYLDLSIRMVSGEEIDALRNKNGNIYYACSGCAAKKNPNRSIYITDYGTCYHLDLGCSGLKRSVYMIPLSEAGGKGACSKCGNP